MSVLWRKLLRDLWHTKSQCAAVALLIALGVGTFVGSASTHRSLEFSRDTYYADYGLAHLFVELARAPLSLQPKLARIDGVDLVQPRLASVALVRLPGFDSPVSARIVGLPDNGSPALGRLHIRRGRLPNPIASLREIVVSEALANAHHLEPGGSLRALINGRHFDFAICGIGLSPEHVYEVRPGDIFPDNLRFGVLWTSTRVLQEALGMQDSFNEVVLSLSPDAHEPSVIAQVDRTLKNYGGQGAYGRHRHVSARFISDELRQLKAMAFLIPSVFLAVAVYLLNMIVRRIIATQRETIATLKALGYGNFTIGTHYLGFTLVVVVAGALFGAAIGYGYGRLMTGLYADYYRFARFHYALSLREIVVSVALSLAFGLTGTLGAVRRAVRLPPAEAMQPAPPAIYHHASLELFGLGRHLSPVARMVLRNLSRRPLRAMASCLGIACAVALLVTGMFFSDSMDLIIDNQFRRSQRQDLTVTFNRPVSLSAVHELKTFPGVIRAEPVRTVPVVLRHGHRSYRSAVTGLPSQSSLQRVLSTSGAVVDLPEHGIMLSETLANNLDASIGDTIDLQLVEGHRALRQAVVTAIADEPFGTSAYASMATANTLAGTGPQITSVLLSILPDQEKPLNNRLQSLPTVAAVTSRKAMLDSFDRMTGEVVLVFAAALSIFAGAMAAGVVYNAARVSLSERERELATMRVMGLTINEVFLVLFGELLVLVGLALPTGCGLGYLLAQVSASASSTEMYRVPAVVLPITYLFSMAVVVVSTALAAIVVRRRLERLDLVAVLKTKE